VRGVPATSQAAERRASVLAATTPNPTQPTPNATHTALRLGIEEPTWEEFYGEAVEEAKPFEEFFSKPGDDDEAALIDAVRMAVWCAACWYCGVMHVLHVRGTRGWLLTKVPPLPQINPKPRQRTNPSPKQTEPALAGGHGRRRRLLRRAHVRPQLVQQQRGRPGARVGSRRMQA
jgi:hypothetical protein